MKVSILVPIKDYIERRCYEALRAQTFTDRSIIIHQREPGNYVPAPLANRYVNISANRNDLRAIGLATESTHFLWVDSDVVLPPHAIETLLGANKDIVGAWVPFEDKQRGWIAGRVAGGTVWHVEPRSDGLEVVDFTTFGCMLVTRAALETVPLDAGVDNACTLGDGREVMQGETFAFGLAAQAKGFEVYAHGGVICDHIKKDSYV
jgi:hypothetical protein